MKLKNYRQYKGPIKIDFCNNIGEKNFTIIEGPNGSGKSNILNSITWCLYGDEIHLKSTAKALPLVNAKAFDGSEDSNVAEVEVELHMRDEKNKKYIFIRRAGFRKEGNNIKRIRLDSASSKPQRDGTVFEVMHQEGGDMVNAYVPDYFVEQLFPSDIREYFFFDGERLDKYFLQSSGERIEQAVFDISQISIIEVVQKKLEKRRRVFIRMLKKLNPKVDEYEHRLKSLRESEHTHIERLSYHEMQREKAEKNEAELNRKLRECSAEEIKRLQQRRDELETEISSNKKLKENLKEEKIDNLTNSAPKILSYKAIDKTIKIIEEKSEKGKLPPKVRRVFLEDILKEKKCICGTNLEDNPDCRKRIEELFKITDPVSDISEKIIEGRVLLRNVIENLDDFSDQQNDYTKKINKLENKLVEDNQELKTISKKIKDTDVEEIKRWEEQLQKYKDAIKSVSEVISTHKLRLEKCRSSIKEINNQIQKEADKQGKHTELSKIMRFCRDSIQALEEIKMQIMSEVREKIEQKTREHFFNLIWKKDTYKDVKIDEKYNLSVLNYDNMEALDSLSKGERQVLALSFMAALNDVSGFKAPIIIDTPLGRISHEPRLNIADSLPSYLKDRQVTILATETEYTPPVRERLLPSVGKEYRIDFHDIGGKGIAEVIEYE